MSLLNTDNILDLGLNVAIQHIASRLFPCGFDVSPDAPGTYEALCDHVSRTGRMVVWDGSSDRTIYGDDETNYAFRAWHDFHHVMGKHDFTAHGEAAACEAQCADLIRVYGDCAKIRYWCEIIRAEVIGQGEYSRIHGEFPTDQLSFVRHYLVNPLAAVETRH